VFPYARPSLTQEFLGCPLFPYHFLHCRASTIYVVFLPHGTTFLRVYPTPLLVFLFEMRFFSRLSSFFPCRLLHCRATTISLYSHLTTSNAILAIFSIAISLHAYYYDTQYSLQIRCLCSSRDSFIPAMN
jgi:hypothetical protein